MRETARGDGQHHPENPREHRPQVRAENPRYRVLEAGTAGEARGECRRDRPARGAQGEAREGPGGDPVPPGGGTELPLVPREEDLH